MPKLGNKTRADKKHAIVSRLVDEEAEMEGGRSHSQSHDASSWGDHSFRTCDEDDGFQSGFDFTTKEGLKMILAKSIFPIVGTLFHPTYMMANAVYSDQIKSDPAACAAAGHDPANENCITGETFQAAFGLGSATMGIIMQAPVLCFNLGLANIIPHAFGSGEYKLCGAYLNRMMILQAIVFIPVLIPIQFIDRLFFAMGVEAAIAEQAALYVRLTSPGLIFLGWSVDYLMYGQHQGKPIVNLVSIGTASILHFFIAYHLAITWDLKMWGLGIASTIQFMFRFLFAHLYTIYTPELKRGLIPFTAPETFQDWGEVASAGYHSFLLRVMSWWTFDLFTWFASFLDRYAIAAQTIFRNVGLFTYMVPFGLSNSANFFVGKFVGGSRVDLTKKIEHLCLYLAAIFGLVTMFYIFIDQNGIMSFYSDNETVHEELSNAWYIFTIFIFFDSMQTVASGIITGLGLMGKVKMVTMVTYLAIGVPISLYMMFKLDMGVEGLWYGPTISCIINYLIY
eukprot:CAMPEP_0170482006 /NCGR_PEP_ID=MMETSP0208-20121228/2219_1 /TAXON_ID=197538 /ORGANISM="Strombidium inclinatum, Strain S3" /LENGTH=508 /DNA_ID=CAMNT_0010754799 /DNA_START=8 /DNA_END=1534 /DNA_ORIENTATION=+